MTEQRFNDDDVIWRWKPPFLGEHAFTKCASSVDGLTMHVWCEDHWEWTLPRMNDVAELLRQLTAVQERVAGLEAELEMLKGCIRYWDAAAITDGNTASVTDDIDEHG